jgi:predicted P-loop ATPase
MKIDYRGKFKAQLQENILKVRDEIDNPDFVFKITNHADKYDRDFNEVRSKILTDDFFAETFAKDPAKQNIYEKLAAEYVSSIECVNDFKNLANSSKMFVINGEITDQRLNDVKSIDFTFNLNVSDVKYNFYCSHKYIKALNGGAQDNQYNDIRNFLRNCDKKSEGNNYFIAICDGPYFTSKLETLNNDFGSKNVITLTIDELEDYLLSIVKEKTLS